jgi:hypothetical protein
LEVRKLRAKFDGKVLIPVEPVELPTDVVLNLQVEAPADHPTGSPPLLLQVMQQPPHLSAEDVAELEQAIESGKQPVKYDSVFDDLA